jgi:hypothetical protein
MSLVRTEFADLIGSIAFANYVYFGLLRVGA